MQPFTALVLAGRRGPDDPLAKSRGASHRALLPVAGVPMLARVLTALRGARHVAKIWISIDAPEVLASVLAPFPDVPVHQSKESPAPQRRRCARRARRRARAGHHRRSRASLGCARRPLPRRRGGREFRRRGGRRRAVRVRGRRASAARTWIRLRCGSYTGANLFAFQNARARRAAEFFARAGAPPQEAVAHDRSARSDARDRIPRRNARPRVRCKADLEERRRYDPPRPARRSAAAIDVDKAADLALAEKILAGEGGV
jgi:hypothetical protein